MQNCFNGLAFDDVSRWTCWQGDLDWQLGTSLSLTPKLSFRLNGGGAYEQYDADWQALGPCLEKKEATQ